MIERQTGSGWRRLASVSVKQDSVFTKALELDGPAKLRATASGEQSLIWTSR